MSNAYEYRLDSTAGSVHDHDDSETKCWDCGGMFPASDLVNGKRFWRESDRDFIPLCVPCYEEFEQLDAQLEREEEKQIEAAIHTDVFEGMLNDLRNIHK